MPYAVHLTLCTTSITPVSYLEMQGLDDGVDARQEQGALADQRFRLASKLRVPSRAPQLALQRCHPAHLQPHHHKLPTKRARRRGRRREAGALGLTINWYAHLLAGSISHKEGRPGGGG